MQDNTEKLPDTGSKLTDKDESPPKSESSSHEIDEVTQHKIIFVSNAVRTIGYY